jgi:anti-sigma B factor antagonist
MTDEDRAFSVRRRAEQVEERLRRLRARLEQVDAGGPAGLDAAEQAMREAAASRQRAAEARQRALRQREQSAVAHERAAAMHDELAAGRPGAMEHRVRAAWHREHAEADRMPYEEGGYEEESPAAWRSTWDRPQQFSCDRVDLDDVTVLVLTGDVDLDTAPELRRTLYTAIRQGRPRLLIDMTDTSFCDSTGLGVLVGALRRARAEKGWIRLVNPSRQIGKVLKITYLDHVFPVHASLEEARAQLSVSQSELIAGQRQAGERSQPPQPI